jgi:LuxR family transcriptional regulator, maltose regulon positive regulatory protein
MTEALRNRTALAKTTPPAIGSAIRREKLFSRLDGPPGRQAVWISGPAGAGKTTLAASYVEARGYQSAWYQLDRDDDDIATFFHYLKHAVRKIHPGPIELPSFVPVSQDEAATLSRNCFREIFSGVAAPSALVLNDLHELALDGPLVTALESGLAQVPRDCCVIVTSRAEPPQAFARMRADRQMTCVGWDDLRLDRAELAEVAGLRGHALTPEAADALLERTQGWAAGLVVMLEHAKFSGALADVAHDTAPQLLFDYFAGEIFDRFSAQTRDFLLRIASLPRMTVDVAQQVTGDTLAGRRLANLALNDYFVREVVGESTRMYEIHPLMREFLLSRAAVALPQAVGIDALRRSAQQLLDGGQIEDAAALFVECRDWPQVARLAIAQASAMLDQGRHQTLRRWIEMLPDDLLAATPQLLNILGASSIQISPRTARRHFDRACHGFERLHDCTSAVRAICGAMNAIMLEFDDLSALDPYLERLSNLSEADPATREALAQPELVHTQLCAMALRGASQSQPSRGARASYAAPRFTELPVRFAVFSALLALLRGDFGAGDTQLEAISPHGLTGKQRIALEMIRSFRHWLDATFALARHAARDGIACAQAIGIRAFDAWLRLLAVAASIGLNDFETAKSELDALESPGMEIRRGDRALLKYLRAWLGSAEADQLTAFRAAQSAARLASECGVLWLECLARLLLAQASARATDRATAEAQLRAAAALAERLDSNLLRCSVHGTWAGALSTIDTARAVEEARISLSLVREHGYRHVVGVVPHVLGEVCGLALQHRVEVDTARALARSAALPAPAGAQRLRQWPWAFEMSFFGGFDLMRESRCVEFASKGAGRPVELLKVLAAQGGRRVRRDVVADALWPNAEADFAQQSFNQTLHRLRRNILDNHDALLLRDGGLSLNPALFWVDTWALEQTMDEIDTRMRVPRSDATELKSLLDTALGIYRGPFLPDESDLPIYIGFREYVRGRLLRGVCAIAARLQKEGDHDAAIDAYIRLIDRDPLFEAPHRKLMECYLVRGAQADGVAAYERLRALLAAKLRTYPSAETQGVYARLRGTGGE